MQHMKRRPDTTTNKSYCELHLPGVSKTPPADGPVLSREIYLTFAPGSQRGGWKLYAPPVTCQRALNIARGKLAICAPSSVFSVSWF